MAQLFSLGHIEHLDITEAYFVAESELVRRFEMSKISGVSSGSARAGLMRRASAAACRFMSILIRQCLFGRDTLMWPNKALEPTAVGAVSSAVAVHVASRRWLSFFR